MNPRKMFSGARARVIILLLIISGSLAFFTGCGAPNSNPGASHNSPDSIIDNQNQGILKIKLVIPNYQNSNRSQFTAKTIDPLTQYLEIDNQTYTTLKITEVDLDSYGTKTGLGTNIQWEGQFSLQPGLYRRLVFKLLDSNHNPLTQGVAKNVNLAPNTITQVSVGCLPVNYTPIFTDGQITGSVTAGKMVYYSYYMASGLKYDITVTPTSGQPDLYLFGPSGALVTSLTSEGLPKTISFDALQSGFYYVGIYAVSGSAAFGLSIALNNPPDPEANHLVINEVYFDYPSAIEIYNPTNNFVNLHGWTVKTNYSNITLPDGIVIPPHGYWVLFGEEPDPDWGVDPTGMLYMVGTYFWLGGGGFVELKNDSAQSVDFVEFNGNTYGLPEGASWTGPDVIRMNSSTIARKVNTPLDTDSALDWENTYGTLGLFNNTNGNIDIPIFIN
ncbi:MAG TPA: lamin tail domain-containing protein [Bacillota bacterium]|nr:lamin tail domain-containing protein [Bacillota bacterium]